MIETFVLKNETRSWAKIVNDENSRLLRAGFNLFKYKLVCTVKEHEVLVIYYKPF